MNKNDLKRKNKDELIEMIEHLELVIDEIKKQTGTGEKVVNAVNNVYERILDFNIYKIRHDVCEKIRDQFIYKNNTKELDIDYDISTHRLNEFLGQIEDGEI